MNNIIEYVKFFLNLPADEILNHPKFIEYESLVFEGDVFSMEEAKVMTDLHYYFGRNGIVYDHEERLSRWHQIKNKSIFVANLK